MGLPHENLMERGQQWVEELLHLARISGSVSAEKQTDCYWLTIEPDNLRPEQLEILIGSNGSALDAIQYLANAILNLRQPSDSQAAYTIELDGYRVRREAQLKAMAEEAVRSVRETGEEFEMKSLSSAERRQVHTFLKEYEDLETYSRGQEPNRRLVVRRR
jgi:spoIIIJ-associated protein